MGNIENRSRKKTRGRHIKKIVLRTVAALGMLTVSLVAPNIFSAMRRLGMTPAKFDVGNITRARKKLVLQGYLKYAGNKLCLTKKGEQELVRIEARDYRLSKPKRWDGKWRVLVFDIPEFRKRTRDKIRRTLISIGFFRLQDSVWIYPYDCEDLITLLKADFQIGRDLLYMVVYEIENDLSLKQHFKLG